MATKYGTHTCKTSKIRIINFNTIWHYYIARNIFYSTLDYCLNINENKVLTYTRYITKYITKLIKKKLNKKN